MKSLLGAERKRREGEGHNYWPKIRPTLASMCRRDGPSVFNPFITPPCILVHDPATTGISGLTTMYD